MVCGELGGGPARERSVPSDASATRGGGETVPVPLIECTLTVAKAGATSDVRRLGRTDVECAATDMLLARLRPPPTGEGDGGSVVGLDSGGCCCWTSSVSMGQRCTRRRKPCMHMVYVRISSWVCMFVFSVRREDTHLDDAETCKPPNIDAETAHVVVLHPFKDRLSRSHT